MAVQVHALDDAGILGHAMVIQVDINRLVGFHDRRGGNRRLGQQERWQKRAGGQAA